MARRIGMRAAVFGRRVICRCVKVMLRSIAIFLELMDEALFGRPVDGPGVEGVGEVDNFCSVNHFRSQADSRDAERDQSGCDRRTFHDFDHRFLTGQS